MVKILLKRTDDSNKNFTNENLEYGELALKYSKEDGGLYYKNAENEIIKIKNSPDVSAEIDSKVSRLMTDTELKFFCVEPVTVTVTTTNNEIDERVFEANTLVDMFLNSGDSFTVTTTSSNSIATLMAWPGALGTFYDWLEGVNMFDGILFDMNNEEFYTKWSQGNQGLYHVQYAQYKNCIFWSDLPYISEVTKRTNYTLYYTSELPLCFSTIPDNTFKSFYYAYSVTCDPNWSNPAYKESFSKATWATQVFSYYGLHSIGLFDTDGSEFNITLPKDCRGLMFYAPNVLNAGVFDAINVTNFGAKSGSWRDAFGYCYQLTNLYIKNLKVDLNVSWSPINQQSLEFILSEAANTKAITIWVSPHTFYALTDSNKNLAAEKNITLSLISTNTTEDNRLAMLKTDGDGTKVLTDNGEYRVLSEYVTNSVLETKVNEAIAGIIDNAPETLDTLGELAAAFNENADVVEVLNQTITNKSNIDHTHDDRYYTKAEVDALLTNYVSRDTVAQMIQDALDNYSNNTPEEPSEPSEPSESIGTIEDDNSISIDETQLENGVYTLKYIDSNDIVIDNFNDITSFEVNN